MCVRWAKELALDIGGDHEVAIEPDVGVIRVRDQSRSDQDEERTREVNRPDASLNEGHDCE